MNTPTPLLSPQLISLIQKGVSTIVASADTAMRPSIMRAVGSTITPDGLTLTVYLARQQSRQVLLDLASTGRIAVVFSQPHSHRTVQVKANHVRMRPMQASDLPILQQYLSNMEDEIALVGFDAAFTRRMLAYNMEDVVAVSFEAHEAFDQTPGPMAGSRIGLPSQGQPS